MMRSTDTLKIVVHFVGLITVFMLRSDQDWGAGAEKSLMAPGA